jgi:hypothetical protein
MADEYLSNQLYVNINNGDRYDEVMCIYEGKLLEIYHDIRRGIYLRDPKTREHIAVVKRKDVQHIKRKLDNPIKVRPLDTPVDFKTDPIGTLYIDLKHDEPCISTWYSEDNTYMDGVYPVTDFGTGSLTVEDVVYGAYETYEAH